MARITIDGVWRETLAETRAHFTAFATLTAAFILLPALLLGAAAPASQPFRGLTPGTMPHFPAWLFPAFIAIVAFQSVGTLTIVAIAGDAARPVNETVGQTLARVLPGVLRYLGALFLLCLAYLALTVPIGFAFALVLGGLAASGVKFDSASPFAVGVPVLLVILALLLWIGARLSPMAGVFAIERASPVRGIRRAWVLSDGAGWRTALVILVFSLAVLLILLVTQALAAALGVAATLAGAHSVGSILFVIVTAVLKALVSIPFTVALGVIYRQLREGQPA